MDDVSAAKLLISCLDLTSLNETDDEERITALCQKALTPYGNTAAVCVYPIFIPLAKRLLPAEVKTATVINFPAGVPDINLMEKEIKNALSLGCDELDVVLPYRIFQNNDYNFCRKYLKQARELTAEKTLKIIIETGELKTIDAIKKASLLCIEAKADFIKTSTGKTKISATPEAANVILETIKASGKNIGFKASGGIKNITDAKAYLTLSQSVMGPNWADKKRLRIGASSVLDNLLQTITQGY